MDMRKSRFFKYATGAAEAYPEIDKVAKDLLDLRKECERFRELASIFEFPQLVEPVATVGGAAGWCWDSHIHAGMGVCWLRCLSALARWPEHLRLCVCIQCMLC